MTAPSLEGYAAAMIGVGVCVMTALNLVTAFRRRSDRGECVMFLCGAGMCLLNGAAGVYLGVIP